MTLSGNFLLSHWILLKLWKSFEGLESFIRSLIDSFDSDFLREKGHFAFVILRNWNSGLGKLGFLKTFFKFIFLGFIFFDLSVELLLSWKGFKEYINQSYLIKEVENNYENLKITITGFETNLKL